MKIVLDARFYGLENAGLGRYTINLLNELQKLDNHNRYFVLLRKRYFDELNLATNFEKVLADIPHYSVKEQIEIPKIVAKINPDLTHFLHFNVPLNFSYKFIVTIHDVTMHSQSTAASNLFLPVYLIKHFAYKKVFDHAIEKSQKIFTPSQFVKDEIVRGFKIDKNKVVVTHEGVDSLNPISKTWLFQKELYFLYVGNAFPHKNLERAIKAFTDLKINLKIVSSHNKFTKKLQVLVNKLNAEKYIEFLGFVSDEKLMELYKKSSGFIFPSLVEGFGLPGLEAMKNETILLSSDIPVFKEIYDDHAIYFDPKNIESIESAIKKVLSFSKTDREKRILGNKKFVSRYSWEKMTKQTLEVYKTVA